MSHATIASPAKVASLGTTSQEEQVRSALERHPYLKNRNLRFEACQGRVVLRGTVSSYYQKLMAQEVVRRIEGVDEIENQLEVHWS